MGYADLKKRKSSSSGNEQKEEGKFQINWPEEVGRSIVMYVLFFLAIAPLMLMGILMFTKRGIQSGDNIIRAVLINAAITLFLTVMEMLYHFRKEKKQHNLDIGAKRSVMEEAKQWADKVDANNGFLPIDVPIALKQDEAAFYKTFSCLYEVRAIRVTNHLGAGYRVSKRIGVAGGQSVSESHDEWRPISTGTLYITNRRVVFVGEKQSRTIDLKNVVSVRNSDSMLELVSESRAKSMRFTVDNGLIAKVLLDRMIKCINQPLSSLVNTSKSAISQTMVDARVDGIQNPYENGLDASSVRLLELWKRLSQNSALMEVLREKMTMRSSWREVLSNGNLPVELAVMALHDAYKCYVRMGHTIEDLQTEDGFGLLSVIYGWVAANGDLGTLRNLTSSHEIYGRAVKVAQNLCTELLNRLVTSGDNLLLADLMRTCEMTEVHKEYVSRLLDWVTAMAVVDEEITPQEQTVIDYLRAQVAG